MKRFILLLILFLLLPAKAFYSPSGWETNLAEAQAKAAKQNKPLLIVIAGPDWNKSCRSFCKNITNDYLFNSICQKYAVRLFLNQPQDMDLESGKVPKDIEMLQSVLPGTKLPRYAIFDAKLNLLTKPKQRTLSGFLRAVSAASIKVRRVFVTQQEFSELAIYESKKSTVQQKREWKKRRYTSSSCGSSSRSSSSSCGSSSRSSSRSCGSSSRSSSRSCGSASRSCNSVYKTGCSSSRTY